MKRILALLGFALLPIIATAQTSEPELLSYTQEVGIKGANANQIQKWFGDWIHEYGSSFGVGIVIPNRADSILKFEQCKYRIQRGIHCYALFFDIYVLLQDGKYLLDLTNISAMDNGRFIFYKPISKDQKCKTIRNILEQYFSDLQTSVYDVITAHAEVELK